MSAVQSDASDVLRVNKLNTEAGIRDMPFACFQARGGAHCLFSILSTFSMCVEFPRICAFVSEFCLAMQFFFLKSVTESLNFLLFLYH